MILVSHFYSLMIRKGVRHSRYEQIYVLEKTQHLLADAVVVEVRPHIGDNIIDDVTIDAWLQN